MRQLGARRVREGRILVGSARSLGGCPVSIARPSSPWDDAPDCCVIRLGPKLRSVPPSVHTSRALQELRGEGLITFERGKLIVRDWNGLAGIGEFDPTYLHHNRTSGPLRRRDASEVAGRPGAIARLPEVQTRAGRPARVLRTI
jgi:hypothetical protein